MNMQKYRKQIQKRIYIIAFYGLLIVILALREVFIKRETLGNESYYIWGFLIGLSPFFFARLIKYKKILKDEQALQAYYNWEHDERSREIVRRAGAATLQSGVVLLFLVALFFPDVRFPLLYVLSACILGLGLLMMGWKMYFKKKI